MSRREWRTDADTDEKLYECADCLEHHSTEHRLTVCPDCGGRVENLSKARAE